MEIKQWVNMSKFSISNNISKDYLIQSSNKVYRME